MNIGERLTQRGWKVNSKFKVVDGFEEDLVV
jgi:hypothetical protein